MNKIEILKLFRDLDLNKKLKCFNNFYYPEDITQIYFMFAGLYVDSQDEIIEPCFTIDLKTMTLIVQNKYLNIKTNKYDVRLDNQCKIDFSQLSIEYLKDKCNELLSKYNVIKNEPIIKLIDNIKAVEK